MKTIQLIKRLDPVVTGQDEEGNDITETPVEVLHTESVEDDRWPNATRRYRLQAEKLNAEEQTDTYAMREAPDVEAS